MYGGLFGDLPSTKNASKKDDQTKTDEPQQRRQGDTCATTCSTDPAATTESSKKRTVSSIVSGIGNSGTSMAFVPTALRQKKKPTPAPLLRKTKQGAAASAADNHASLQEVVVVHEKGNAESTLSQRELDSSNFAEETLISPKLYVESEDLQRLHASVEPEDMYDPHVPNDLLAYWDRKAMEKERIKLEQEAKDTLVRQEHLRQQLAREREALQKTGTVEQILEHRTKTAVGMGRGRGRGVSNLPAWLVQKQKEVGSDLPAIGSTTVLSGPVSPSVTTSRTVVLSNLTAPGQLDDDLADEVRQECEEQCGVVTSVELLDAQPPSRPAVQVLVEFAQLSDAKRAVEIFHGRRFGERRITAEMKR